MIVLGVDTSASARGVALASGENILVENVEFAGSSHSARLIPMVRAALEAAGRDKRELEGIAVTVGPGSYTGLRIGVATVKALAGGLGIPAVGVGTLEALAFGFGPRDDYVCPLLDARRGRVYTALYGWDSGDIVEVLPPAVVSLGEWLERIPDGRVFFLGEGLVEHGKDIAAARGDLVCFGSKADLHIHPDAVANLGYRRFLEGKGADPELLSLVYLAGDGGGPDPAESGKE